MMPVGPKLKVVGNIYIVVFADPVMRLTPCKLDKNNVGMMFVSLIHVKACTTSIDYLSDGIIKL